MEFISARSNEKIKYAAKLASSASFRRETGEFLLEGARLCSDAAASGIAVRRLFVTSEAAEKYSEYIADIKEVCGICCEISGDVARKLSDTENPQGIFCVCGIKGNDEGSIDTAGKYLALENLQDPSNLGAVCRSAEALGLSGVIVSGGCDIYNPKALRAAMGSSLRINVIQVSSLPDFIGEMNSKGMLTLASVPDAGAKDIRTVSKNSGVICCVGNEGNGLTEQTQSACSERVTIPMGGRAESFNASAAAAILAWELIR